jgi:hypothetical protein
VKGNVTASRFCACCCPCTSLQRDSVPLPHSPRGSTAVDWRDSASKAAGACADCVVTSRGTYGDRCVAGRFPIGQYGSGLRLLECLRLRVKDLDFAHVVETELRAHLQRARQIHDADVRLGFGSVVLPNALGRKFLNADRDWLWQWVFPATTRYVDAAAGTERRHHLHESAVQRAVHEAARCSVPSRHTC